MPLAMTSEAERALSMGLVWTVGDTTGTIASGGSTLYGIQTGTKPVIYMNRVYSSASTLVLVELFENSYTGGNLVVSQNRNFTNKNAIIPAVHVQGPTGTPSGSPKASVVLQGGGLLAGGTGISPESEWYILEANKQYLLRISNNQLLTGATVSFRFTFKAEQ